MTFLPKFADLVRNGVTVDADGAVTLGAAVPGFSGLAEALSAGDQFYYCLANDDRPNEREVGRGRLLAGGRVERQPMSGAPAIFTSGAKSISLIAAADYFRGADAAAVRGGVSVLPASPASLFAAAAPVALQPGRAVVPDLGAGINFDLTVTGDTLIADPVAAKPGQSGRLRIAQDSTGSRRVTFGDRWRFAGGAPLLSDEPGADDIVAYFVNASGEIEASLLPTLEKRPIPLAVSDFQHDFYSIRGVPAAFADMWAPEASYGPFRTSSLVPGTGLTVTADGQTNNHLRSSAAQFDALDIHQGITAVFDYSMAQAGSAKPQLMFEVMDVPNYLQAHGFQQEGTSVSGTGGETKLYDYSASPTARQQAGPPGDFRAAVTLSDTEIAYSINGAPVFAFAHPIQGIPDANALILSVFVSHNSPGLKATSTLRSLKIYAKQPTAQLTQLSQGSAA